jgi:nitrite reductase/ring-hydroxylating ferredoxin subunit
MTGDSWRLIGTADNFPPESCRMVTIGGHEVGVYNIDGKLYAIRSYCPHQGAPICKGSVGGTMLPSVRGEYAYGLEGRVIHCPWHQWAYDIPTGRALFGIDRSRLICHAVIRKGDEVYVNERVRKANEALEENETLDALIVEALGDRHAVGVAAGVG